MSTAIVQQPVRSAFAIARWPAKLVTRWHLLSLDAPSVAAVWLLVLNRERPLRELRIEAAALAIAVWMIYVLDRLLDADRQAGTLHRRHYFHLRHRRFFLRVFVLLVPVLTVLVRDLPPYVRSTWLLLLVPLAMYAACVHFLDRRVPKEFLVGAFFAMVVCTPSWYAPEWRYTWPAALTFFLLCCWNCLAITHWEAEADRGARKTTEATQLLRRVTPLLFGVSLVGVLLSRDKAVGFALAVSGVMLVVLHRTRHRFSPVVLRSLADAVLLSPLLVLPLLHQR